MPRASLVGWLLPLSLAADAGAALPPETGARTALLGLRAAALLREPTEATDVCYGGLLRHLGCSATAHEETRLMGDEQELRSSFALVDGASPAALLRAAATGFGRGRSLPERARRVARFLAGAPSAVPRIFTDRCEVATQLATRLALPAGVRRVLAEAYERFDGKGTPRGSRGDALGPATRILAVAELASTCAMLPGGSEMTRDLLAHRRGSQFDPVVVDLFLREWSALTEGLGDAEPALAALAPDVDTPLDLADGNALALVFADFADLKSTFTIGHSRRVAALAEVAARELGLPAEDQRRLSLAGLLHDLGRVAVSNAVWDKPGALDAREREVAQGHVAFTERVLSRTEPWRALAVLAASDHERGDGSGYPRRVLAPNVGMPARILAAADVLVALTEARPHRPPHVPGRAAEIVRGEAAQGRLDRSAVDAVLAGAGLGRGGKTSLPRGITERELEVLRRLVRGLVDKEIAAQLGISHRTVVLEQLGLQAGGYKTEFFLSHRPVPSTITVLEERADGVTIPHDHATFDETGVLVSGTWTWDASRNSITFEEWVPAPLAAIVISYTLLASE